MYLNKKMKYEIATIIAKDSCKIPPEYYLGILGKLGDKIYFNLFSEYLLLLDMLPKSFFIFSDSFTIKTPIGWQSFRVSTERYCTCFNGEEEFDLSHLDDIVIEYTETLSDYKEVLDEISRRRKVIIAMISHITTDTKLLKQFPEFKESYKKFKEKKCLS